MVCLELIIEKNSNSQNKTTKTIMNISEAVQTIKQVGLNVYTPKTKDSGFIKVYVEPITKLLVPHSIEV